MTDKIDIEEVKRKLYERLVPSGWAAKLKTFLLSQDMTTILEQLLKEVEDGHNFTPVIKQIFRGLEECPYSELKVVMMGQDSYPYPPKERGQLPVADGIAFSCGNTMKPEASLRYILKEVAETVYPGKEYDWNPDLKRWSNQGILLINCALTTRMGKIGMHYEIWKPFITFLFDMLNTNNNGLIYCFLGRKAQEWGDMISDSRNWKLHATHPASAAYQQLESWDSGNLFVKVQDLVYKNFKYNIIW